jgi:hypothetical protein
MSLTTRKKKATQTPHDPAVPIATKCKSKNNRRSFDSLAAQSAANIAQDDRQLLRLV